MAEKGIWLSTQPFVSDDDYGSDDRPKPDQLDSSDRRHEYVYASRERAQIKTAFGTDCLFSSKVTSAQGFMLTHLTRWYDNADILKMALPSTPSFWRCLVRQTLPGKAGGHRGGCRGRFAVIGVIR